MISIKIITLSSMRAVLASTLALVCCATASAATVNGSFDFAAGFAQVLDTGGTPEGVDFGTLPAGPTPTDADGVFDADISSGVITAASGDFATAGLGLGTAILLTMCNMATTMIRLPRNQLAT